MDKNCALKAEDIVILLCQLPFVPNTIISGFKDADFRKESNNQKRAEKVSIAATGKQKGGLSDRPI